MTWFGPRARARIETPTHGEKFDPRGNYYAGPAMKGLDRYPIAVEGDAIYIDLGTVIPGPERGEEDALEPEGAFCSTDRSPIPKV